MGADAFKVRPMVALNEDTFLNLDADVMFQGGEKMACLETMPKRLRHFRYAQMLSYLKQSNLMNLVK